MVHLEISFVTRAHTTQYGLKNIKNSGTRLWLTLPDSIKNSPSKNVFVLSLKKHLLLQYNTV